MTSETGSRRHPTPDPHGPPHVRRPQTEFTSYRTLDPVRAVALTAAVTASPYMYVEHTGTSADGILSVAAEFERYLTGEEADGEN